MYLTLIGMYAKVWERNCHDAWSLTATSEVRKLGLLIIGIPTRNICLLLSHWMQAAKLWLVRFWFQYCCVIWRRWRSPASFEHTSRVENLEKTWSNRRPNQNCFSRNMTICNWFNIFWPADLESVFRTFVTWLVGTKWGFHPHFFIFSRKLSCIVTQQLITFPHRNPC